MDEVESAIVSVSRSVATGQEAAKWFEVVCSTYDDFGENWNLFKDAVTTRAYAAMGNAQVAEDFVSLLDADITDKTGVLAAMRERGDDLPRLYATLVAEEQAALRQGPGAGTTAGEGSATAGGGWGEHTAAWYEHLTTGKHWAGWTGADADWDEFTRWFRYYAEEEGASEGAESFLSHVEASPDKVGALVAFGITVGEPSAVVAAVEDRWSHWSPAEWYEYLTTLPSDPCPTWNGLPGEHWDYFKYWFVEKAVAEGGLGATEFIAEIEAAPDKVVALNRHGITIRDPNGIPVAPQPPRAAPTAPDGAEAAAKTPVEEAEGIVARAVAKLRSEHPELAGVSQQALTEFARDALRDSVLSEQS